MHNKSCNIKNDKLSIFCILTHRYGKHKKSEKSTRIFLNTDYGREKSPLTGNTYIYQHFFLFVFVLTKTVNYLKKV